MEQSYKKAVEMYEECIKEIEFDAALNNLAFLFNTGEGVSKDPQRAFELYERAAKQKASNFRKFLVFHV